MAHRRSTKDLRVLGDNGSQRDGWSATMSQESFDTCWTPREQSGLTAGRPPATPVPAKKTSRRGVLSPLGLDDMRHSLESEVHAPRSEHHRLADNRAPRSSLPPEPSTSPSRPGLTDMRRRAKKNALPPTNINPFLVARKKRNRRRKRISLHTTHVSRYLMDFEEIDCIGRGTNCEVFRCRRREDGCTYAMKRVIRPVKGPASKAPAMKEVFALSALSGCPHIVRYYSAWREDEKLYIQTELCWGSAEDLVTNQRHRHIDSGSTHRAMNAPDSVEEEIMAAPRIPSTARKPVSSKSRLMSMDGRPQHMEGGGSRMRRMAPPERPQKQQQPSFGLHPGGAGNDTANTRVTPTLDGAAADSISSNEASAVGTPSQGRGSGGSTPVMRPADSRLVGGFLHVTGATGGGGMGRMRDLKHADIDDDTFLDEDRTEAARTGLGGTFDLAGSSGRDSTAMDEEDCDHRADTAEYTDSRVSHSLQVPLSTSQSSLHGHKTRGASESYEGVLGRTPGEYDGGNAEEGGEDDTWMTELNMKGAAPHRADGTVVRRHTQSHLRQRSTFDREGGRGRVGSSVTMAPQATVSRESSDDRSRPDSGPTTRHTPSIQRAAGESARHHVLNEMRWRANTFGTGRDQPRVLSQSSVEYEFRDSDGMDTASAAVTPITQSPAAPKGTRGFGILPTPAKGCPSSPPADEKPLSMNTSDQVFAGAQGTGSAEYGEGGQVLKAHVRSSRESSLGPDVRGGNVARSNHGMADVYAIEAQRRSLESLYAESFDTDGSLRDSAESWKFNGRTRLDFGDAVVAVEDLQSPGAVREGSAGYLAARQQYQSAVDGEANPVVPFRAGGMQGGDDGMELQDVSMELHDADAAHANAVGVSGVHMEAATTELELEGGWAAQSFGAETADSLLRSGGDDKRCRVGASGGPFRGPGCQRASDDWGGRRSAPSPALEVMVVAPDSGLVIPASEGRGRMVESELIRLCEHVCRALHYMHSHNLVHLDVKPANILIAFANGVASVDADGEWVMDANNAAACLGVDKLSSRTAVSLATTHTQAMPTTPFSSSSGTANDRYDSLGIAGPRMSQAFPLHGCSLANTSTQPGQNMTIRVTDNAAAGPGSQGPAPSLVCEVRGVVYKLGDLGQVADINAQSVQEGDTKYLSRELLQGDCSNLAASDIFSLGASLYELATGRELPVTGQPFQDLRDGNLETLPDYSEDLQCLIREMMHPEPARRPSAAAILERPLLRMRQSTVGMGLRGINNVSPSGPMSPAQTWGGSVLPFSSAKADLPSVHESPQDPRQPQAVVTAAGAGLWSPQQFPATSLGSGGRGISTAPFLTAPTSAGLITSQPAVTAMPPSARAVRPRSPPASTPLVRPRIRSRLPGHVGENADDQLAAEDECMSSSDAAERVSPVPPMPSLNSPLESTSPPPLPLSQQRHVRTQSHDAGDQQPFMKLQATVQPHDQARLERRKAVAEANANSAAGRSGQVAEVLMSRFEAATGSPAPTATATAFSGLSDRAETDTGFASDFTVPSANVRPARGYQSPEQRKLSLLQRHMSGVRQQQQQRQQQRLHEQQQQDKAAGLGQSGLPHPEGSPALLVTRRSAEQSMQDSMDDASLLATMSVAPDAPRDELLATIAALQSQLRQLTQSGSGSSSYAMEDDKHVGQPDMRGAVYH